MALILSLETSTVVCSVALHSNKVLLRDLVIQEPQAHASRLAPMIMQVMKESAKDFDELNAVCVSAGPGSYTGLRIGASTAKGLCFASDLPLIAVPTLKLLAYQSKKITGFDGLLCPMIDAGRMEVYCEVFNDKLQTISPITAMMINTNSFAELLSGNKMLFFGNGAAKCRQVLRDENVSFLDGLYPSAENLGELASEKFEQKDFVDLVNFTPLYHKDFIARKAQSLLS